MRALKRGDVTNDVGHVVITVTITFLFGISLFPPTPKSERRSSLDFVPGILIVIIALSYCSRVTWYLRILKYVLPHLLCSSCVLKLPLQMPTSHRDHLSSHLFDANKLSISLSSPPRHLDNPRLDHPGQPVTIGGSCLPFLVPK